MLEDHVKEALTFDDLLLVPAASAVLPRDVETSTLLTKNIPLPLSPSTPERILRCRIV